MAAMQPYSAINKNNNTMMLNSKPYQKPPLSGIQKLRANQERRMENFRQKPVQSQRMYQMTGNLTKTNATKD